MNEWQKWSPSRRMHEDLQRVNLNFLGKKLFILSPTSSSIRSCGKKGRSSSTKEETGEGFVLDQHQSRVLVRQRQTWDNCERVAKANLQERCGMGSGRKCKAGNEGDVPGRESISFTALRKCPRCKSVHRKAICAWDLPRKWTTQGKVLSVAYCSSKELVSLILGPITP